MDLVALRATLREKHGALSTLKAKALAPDAAADDVTALESALGEIEGIEKKIDLAEKVEAAEAKASKVATAPAERPDDIRVPAAPEQKVDVKQKLSIVAAAVIKAGKDGNPEQVLRDEGYAGFADALLAEKNRNLRSTGQKAVNTLVSNQGGILVPTPLDGGLEPLLRAEATFLGANPTRVQLVNGQFVQARGATGATASYIAQGALKPVSTPTFDSISMQAKKLAGIVQMTNEARKWTIGNLEQYVRDDLQSALALTFDLNAYLGTGSGASPTGILNKSGVQTYTPTFGTATAPTLAELDAMASGMILLLTAANIFNNANSRWRWVMSYRTAMRLADARVGGTTGDLAFPGMSGANKTFKDIPVIVTSQFPTNGGTNTDETTLALVDFRHVLYGEEEGIRVAMSDQATLDVDGAGTLVHLWQQNMFAILAESEHDFGLRHAKAVVKATIRF